MAARLAARIVAEYSRPGEVVVDPLCRTGVVAVAAAEAGRRGIGVVPSAHRAARAVRVLDRVCSEARRPFAEIRVGDPGVLPASLGELSGHIGLVATAPPDAGTVTDCGHVEARGGGDRDPRPARRRWPVHADGGRQLDEGAAAVSEVWAACFAVLRPGGLLVVVVSNARRGGRRVDVVGATVAAARDAGFGYLQHVIAVHAAIRGGRLDARPAFAELVVARRARAAGEPAHLVVHQDVLVFTKPPGHGGAGGR